MALEIKHLQTSCGDPKVVFEHSGNYMIDGDEFSRLRSENAELKQKLTEKGQTYLSALWYHSVRSFFVAGLL